MSLKDMKPVYETLHNEGEALLFIKLVLCKYNKHKNVFFQTKSLSNETQIILFHSYTGKDYDIGHVGTFAVNVMRMEKGKHFL